VLLEPGVGEFHHFVDLSSIPLPGSIAGIAGVCSRLDG
jgi:hypothetical protein